MKTYLSAVLVSILSCLILAKVFIPFLKKLKVGQPILSYVKEHSYKEGTPTMGGLFIVLSSVISFIIFSKQNNSLAVTSISVTIAFLIVGFIDDFIKIKFKNNKGLTPLQKILFQISIAVIVSVSARLSGITSIYLPFTKNLVEIGFFSVILNVLVFIATVNSVNLTDGLDGLCSSVSIIYLIAISLLTYIEITTNSNYYVNILEYENLILFSLCMAGALIGYLAYNTQKASIFMGDCGSLAIGGAIASISIFTSNTLYIPILGATFVTSALSVIIQVLHFKRTKKRVFLMAPIHHHFQHKGYSEAKISYCYALITAIISAVIIICAL